MNSISIVIITRNEERNIVACIRSAQLVTNDIIVVDALSSDQTANLAMQAGAQVFSIEWRSYGFSRNFGAAKAKNNWILALDADERISNELASAIDNLKFDDINCIYRFRRKNYLGTKKLSFGTPGFDTAKRIYNRMYAQWDLTLVHEKLEAIHPLRKKIRGHIDHFSLKDEAECKSRASLYARMSAEKYFQQGKRIGLLKKCSSPVFNFIKSYVFLLGFLDGRNGWIFAKTTAWYSWLKYCYLHQLLKESKIEKMSFAVKPGIKRA